MDNLILDVKKIRQHSYVDFPASDADNATASLLMDPSVGMWVALGGGADHLSEATARINLAAGARQDAATPMPRSRRPLPSPPSLAPPPPCGAALPCSAPVRATAGSRTGPPAGRAGAPGSLPGWPCHGDQLRPRPLPAFPIVTGG
jgi:hypothetical protein